MGEPGLRRSSASRAWLKQAVFALRCAWCTAHLRGGRELQIPHRGLAFLAASRSWSTVGERGAGLCRKERGVNSATGKVPASACGHENVEMVRYCCTRHKFYEQYKTSHANLCTCITALHGKFDFSFSLLQVIPIPHNLGRCPGSRCERVCVVCARCFYIALLFISISLAPMYTSSAPTLRSRNSCAAPARQRGITCRASPYAVARGAKVHQSSPILRSGCTSISSP